MRIAIALAALLMVSTTAVAARCPRDCKRLFVEQMKGCKAACPARKPGKACRVACVATRKANGKTCKASVAPTPPLCGLPPAITPITFATTSTTIGSITTTTTSTTVVPSTTSTTMAPTNCAVEPDGTPCDRDANLCTHDQCTNGSCQLASSTLCMSPAPCYTSVACDPATGGCSSGGYIGDGKVCGGLATPAGICAAGTCQVGKDCLIAGVPYAAGDHHPDFFCLACQPASDRFGWTPLADGLACPEGFGFCRQGLCNPYTCLIDGVLYEAGQTNPANPCQSCLPGIIQTAWSPGGCPVVANAPPASGGGSCAAPDYNTIQAAVDAASTGQTIVICPGTYNLSAPVTVPKDLSFVGSGQANTIIDGTNGGSRVQLFDADDNALSGGRHVTFRGLTFRNGLTTYGGAIAATTVEVFDSRFTGNTARSAAAPGTLVLGGAIAARDAFVRGCTFDSNVVQVEVDEGVSLGGGAINAITVDVADSTFTNNRVVDNVTVFGSGAGGGAICGQQMDIRNSTFSNNFVMGTAGRVDGGAIFAQLNEFADVMPHLTVVRSTFADNAAADQGGAIYADVDVALVESALLRNTAYDGGAVAMTLPGSGVPPTAMADKSTFDGNVSHGGGAIAGYEVVLTNSTFTNNAASGGAPCRADGAGFCDFGLGAGGAISAANDVTATNCTFAGNVGVYGTIHRGPATNYPLAGGTVTLTNTILVGAPGVSMCSSLGATSGIDGGGNFSVDASCAFAQPTSHVNVSAAALALGPLADNGGPTPTVALSPGSIANGAGICALATDQRGRPRPGPGNPACESGAYELQASAGASCLADEDCDSNVCDGVCKCPRSQLYTFGANEQPGSVWPGGTSTQGASPGCSVTVQNPNADVSRQCGAGTPFSVLQFAGYSSCIGSGGEDGDGCQVTACPLGEGSCCNGRPSFSGNMPGTATASFSVQCLP